MARLLSEEEVADRIDCFGEFDATDEICLLHCGINIACACGEFEEEDRGTLDEQWLSLLGTDLD